MQTGRPADAGRDGGPPTIASNRYVKEQAMSARRPHLTTTLLATVAALAGPGPGRDRRRR